MDGQGSNHTQNPLLNCSTSHFSAVPCGQIEPVVTTQHVHHMDLFLCNGPILPQFEAVPPHHPITPRSVIVFWLCVCVPILLCCDTRHPHLTCTLMQNGLACGSWAFFAHSAQDESVRHPCYKMAYAYDKGGATWSLPPGLPAS